MMNHAVGSLFFVSATDTCLAGLIFVERLIRIFIKSNRHSANERKSIITWMQAKRVVVPPAKSDPNDRGQQSSRNHLNSIDALRGSAALYVACFHTILLPSPRLQTPNWIRPLILSGGTGVTLFFVVSAFTLTISWTSRKSDSHPIRDFYLRRFFRIAPLFYVLLAFMVLENWHLQHAIPSFQELLLNTTLLFNLAPTWSTGIVLASWTIGVEILFYVAFPAVIGISSTNVRLLGCLVGTTLLASLFHFVVASSHLPISMRSQLLTTSFIIHIPVFVLGICAYRTFMSRTFRTFCSRPVSILMITLALAYFVALTYSGLNLDKVGIVWSAPAWTLLLLGLAINPVTAMVNVVTRFYGRISYSVYLNHPIVILLLKPVYTFIYRHVSLPGLAWFPCVVATLVVLTPWAYISYRLIEQPGMRFGSQLIKSLNAPSRLAAMR
jgi:peptidoglycan/LPS O-acetylase OafA/YrhL